MDLQNLTLNGFKYDYEKSSLDTLVRPYKARNDDLESKVIQLAGEVERLNSLNGQYAREVENWKLKYSQLERNAANDIERLKMDFDFKFKQLETSKSSSDRFNLEAQTRPMRQRLEELEDLTRKLKTDNDRLMLDVREKSDEIESWRGRVAQLERNHHLQIDELAIQLENKKKTELDMNVREVSAKFNLETTNLENQLKYGKQRIADLDAKCAALAAEVERLTQLTLERMNDIDSWKVKYSNLEKTCNLRIEELLIQTEIQKKNEMEKLIRELNTKFNEERANFEVQTKNLKKVLIDLETRQTLAQAEKDRLMSTLDEKDKAIEVINAKIGNLMKLKANELEDLKMAMENERRMVIEREIKDANIKFSNERSNYESKIRELKQKNNDTENKVTFLTVELERTTIELEERNQDINKWKNKYAQLEAAKQKEIEDIRVQFEALRKSSLSAQDYHIRFAAERSAYETQIMQLKQKISDLEDRIADLNKENQKLVAICQERQRDLESLKGKFVNIENNKVSEIDELKKELDHYRTLVYEAKESQVKYEVERNTAETQISQLKQTIENSKAELAKCYDLLSARKTEYENLSRALNDARHEASRLSKEYKALEAESMLKNSKYDQLLRETEEMSKSRDMYKQQLEKNTIEISRKNKELLDKIQEVDFLKLKYEEAIASVHV